MSQNKNALIRYKTIDKCLQNKYRNWTLDDLIEACSKALYEYEGRFENISKRTIQLDIQMMRSEKLGYNAPIEVFDRKYYRYSEEDFTITDIPLTESDMNVLTETVEMLKQFKDFSLFNEMTDIIHRLEDKIYVEKTNNRPIIHLDKNDKLKGIHYLDVLYQAILKKIVLKIEYQSFKSRSSNVFVFHPFLLKEYNNRWFIIGKKKLNEDYLNLALDRIISIDFDLSIPYIESDLDPEEYYRNTIGVTVNEKMKPQKVTFLIEKTNAPYVKTKPFHHSQIVIDENELGTVFQVEVVLNFELERLILGFGDSIEVINPRFLRKRISRILLNAGNKYNQDYID